MEKQIFKNTFIEFTAESTAGNASFKLLFAFHHQNCTFLIHFLSSTAVNTNFLQTNRLKI